MIHGTRPSRLGRVDPERPRVRHQGAPWPDHQARQPVGAVGRGRGRAAGARAHPAGRGARAISPGRSPNPPCGSLCNGLSPRCLPFRCGGAGPGAGDRVSAVAVSPAIDGGDIEQIDPVRFRSPPAPGGRDEPAADVRPRPVTACHDHSDHSPPREVLQHAEGVLGHRVPEVVGPSAHNLVEPDQHGPEVLLRRPARQGTDLAFTDRTDRR
jgi:hypothetical protein